jgi:hypothetical protein
MLCSSAVATTDGDTSLHSPVFVVVLARGMVVVVAGDEQALVTTAAPATARRESRET